MPAERRDITDRSDPPPGNSQRNYPTPNTADLQVVVNVPIDSTNYAPLETYTPHDSEDVTGLGLFLCWESEVKSDNERTWVTRVYANRRIHQDNYNFAISYASESIDHPTFQRTYVMRRDEYDQNKLARGTKLTGVLGGTITNGGTGFTSSPTLSFSGGGGTGAAGTCLIYNGKVVSITITNEGTGYTSNPTIEFTGGSGTGAVALAFVQPSGCVLTSEKMDPMDDPQLGGAFVTVTRIYEALPGPTLIDSTYDEESGAIIDITKSIILNTDQVGSIGDDGTITEYQAINKVKTIQIVSKFDMAPSERQFTAFTATHAFPDVLIGVAWLQAASVNGLGRAFDFALDAQIDQGYSGPCWARLTERVTKNFTESWGDTKGIFQFFPKQITIGIAIQSQDVFGINPAPPSAKAQTVIIPPTLHENLTVATPDLGITFTIEMTDNITATSPTALPDPGTWIMKEIQPPEKYRFGYFVHRLLEVQVPNFIDGGGIVPTPYVP